VGGRRGWLKKDIIMMIVTIDLLVVFPFPAINGLKRTQVTHHDYPAQMTPPIRALLIDVSGTLSVGSKPIGNAVSALAKLREFKIPFRFCTNTSKESTRELCQKLEGMRFEVKEGEVWSSIGALKQSLKENAVKRCRFVLFKSPALTEGHN
jgi:hypothetical protein